MDSQIQKYRRLEGRFKTLSGWAAALCLLSSGMIMMVGGFDGQKGPDDLHTYRHDARGAVYYLSDAQEQIHSVAVDGVIGGLSVSLALTIVSLGFKRRADRESQKQLLADEFGPSSNQSRTP